MFKAFEFKKYRWFDRDAFTIVRLPSMVALGDPIIIIWFPYFPSGGSMFESG